MNTRVIIGISFAMVVGLLMMMAPTISAVPNTMDNPVSIIARDDLNGIDQWGESVAMVLSNGSTGDDDDDDDDDEEERDDDDDDEEEEDDDDDD